MAFSARLSGFSILLICSLLLLGCAIGPAFEEVQNSNPERAMLYIFRPDAMAYHPDIYVSEKKVAVLGMGEYTWVELEPGQHLIDVPYHPSRLRCVDLYAEKGESYYVISGYLQPGFSVGELLVVAVSRGLLHSGRGTRAVLAQVDTEAAKKWIEKAQFLEPEINYVPVSSKGAICSLYNIEFRGIEQDAVCGSVDEQYDLARAYTHGAGTHPDEIQAYKWLGIARVTLQKEEKALAWLNRWRSLPTKRQQKIHWLGIKLEELASTMTPGEISAGKRLIQEWKPPKYCEE